MKKLVLTFLIVLTFIAVLGYGVKSVLAEQATPGGIRKIPQLIKERVGNLLENRVENRQQQREERKENVVERVRRAAKARWEVLNRITGHAEILLNKLQERIDRAKTAGKDVTLAEQTMADARAKLTDVKAKLNDLKDKYDKPVDKAGFQAIQTQFKAVWQDLHLIQQDAAKIIKTLKGFNSATSSGKNPQSESTSPAGPRR